MPFELWRQDDNGNRFLIDTYDTRRAAEKRLAELTRVPHKQTYWIAARAQESRKENIHGQ
jgi:hypothetical protein